MVARRDIVIVTLEVTLASTNSEELQTAITLNISVNGWLKPRSDFVCVIVLRLGQPKMCSVRLRLNTIP